MASFLRACERIFLIGLVVGTFPVQGGLSRLGEEYSLSGLRSLDQMEAALAMRGSKGFVVWQDNVTDGQGLGISARRLNGNFSGFLGSFQVNAENAGDQETPQVAMLPNGGAVFVWRGNLTGTPHIYARFMGEEGTFVTGDIRVNSFILDKQIHPVVTVLDGGEVVVVWSSFNQDGSRQGVYGQRFDMEGNRLGGEFAVNQTTEHNQRHPAIAALGGGGFIVAWVHEHGPNALGDYYVDIFGRLYDANGAALGGEFKLNDNDDYCSRPTLAGDGQGGFLLAWEQKLRGAREGENVFEPGVGSGVMIRGDEALDTDSYDLRARLFGSAGEPLQGSWRLNTHTYKAQVDAQAAFGGNGFLVIWNSLDQDGSGDGIYGQEISLEGEPVGDEFRVNTRVISQQIQPAIVSDGNGRFLAVWSGFIGGAASFEVFGQRFAGEQPLTAPEAPFVSALDQQRLSVSWPEVAGFDVAHYELYVDGATDPVTVEGNYYQLAGLEPASRHEVRVAYRLADGRVSPRSPTAAGTTWGADENQDGLPDDWQSYHWGRIWPAPDADSDGDGASDRQEFLAGTDPLDAESVLWIWIESTAQGPRLWWSSQPGSLYQVQTKSELLGQWEDAFLPRLAVGDRDAVMLGGASEALYYRVKRLR